MKQHRILALFLSVLLLTALLTGCGTSSKNMAADTASSAAQNWKTESAAAAEEWGYDTPAEADFYEFMRALDMARNSLKDGEKTLVVSSDSPIARVFSALS